MSNVKVVEQTNRIYIEQPDSPLFWSRPLFQHQEATYPCSEFSDGAAGTALFEAHYKHWQANKVPSSQFTNTTQTSQFLFVLTVVLDIPMPGAYEPATMS